MAAEQREVPVKPHQRAAVLSVALVLVAVVVVVGLAELVALLIGPVESP